MEDRPVIGVIPTARSNLGSRVRSYTERRSVLAMPMRAMMIASSSMIRISPNNEAIRDSNVCFTWF